MSKRGFKGIWIPKEIWLNDELSLQQKVFLVEIHSLDNGAGCWANNEYFAKFFGLSKTRVSLIIKSLIDAGFVASEINKKEGNKRYLRTYLTKVKDPIQQKLKTYTTKVKDPIQQKLKHSNTINNTFSNTINNTTKKGAQKDAHTTNLFNSIKKTFLDHYESTTTLEYYFTGVDAGSITHIIKKIKHLLITGGANDPDDAIINNTFSIILHKNPDEFVKQNLSLRIINQNFNTIINKIKNGKSNNTSGTINKAFAKIDSMHE